MCTIPLTREKKRLCLEFNWLPPWFNGRTESSFIGPSFKSWAGHPPIGRRGDELWLLFILPPKKDSRSLSPMLDLRTVNKTLWIFFNFNAPSSVKICSEKRTDVLCSLDLKDAYFYILLCTGKGNIQGLLFRTLYAICVLLFGLSLPPKIFSVCGSCSSTCSRHQDLVIARPFPDGKFEGSSPFLIHIYYSVTFVVCAHLHDLHQPPSWFVVSCELGKGPLGFPPRT